MMYNRGFGGCSSGFGFFSGDMRWMMLLGFAITMIIIYTFWVKVKHKQSDTQLAVEQLKMRLVKGEITEEEYLKMKNLIQ